MMWECSCGSFLPGHAVVEDRGGEAVGVDLHDAVGAQPGERPMRAKVLQGGTDAVVVGRHHLAFDPVVAERP